MGSFFLFALFVVLFANESLCCPQNCDCGEAYQSECWLDECEDEVVLDEKDFLLIHGKLCSNQRQKISKKSLLTLVVLYDDKCDKLRKCRTVHHGEKIEGIFTTVAANENFLDNKRKPMLPPGLHEDPVEINPEEQEENANDQDENENLQPDEHSIETTMEIYETTSSDDYTTEITTDLSMTTEQNAVVSRKPA